MIAEFHPQAWISDNAVEVDHDGPNKWDCTAEFAAMPPDYRASLLAEIATRGYALDGDDWLKNDPAAPQWVRDHRGPFDIYISEG